jgi:uncharacterized protein
MAAGGATSKGERIDLIDALRGFALLGILLANILNWSGWIFMTPEQKASLAGPGAVAWQYGFHHLFVDGKFYTLFSLLFGIGFAVQLDRLERRGADGLRIFRRRLLILLAIGIVHVALLWDGDILTFYALIGLILPWFRHWSERALLATAAILIFVVPPIGHALFEAMEFRPHQAVAAFGDRIFLALGGTAPIDAVAWLRREDPQSFFTWVMGGWPYAISTRLEGWRIPKLLGIMLIGLLAGRRIAAGQLLGDRRLLILILATGLAIGVPLSFLYAVTPALGQTSLFSTFGTVPLALAYAACFALLWPRAEPALRLLAAPGRMALTNYLMQTLIGILIFYGIGFGLVGRVPPLGIYAIAVAIFAAQTAFSHWWLARHEQGPMERLWRLGTYGRSGRPQLA